MLGVVTYLCDIIKQVVAKFMLESVRSSRRVVFGVVDSSDITICVFDEYSTAVMRVDIMGLDNLITVSQFNF